MKSFDEYTSMIVVSVLSSMVRNVYVNCIFPILSSPLDSIIHFCHAYFTIEFTLHKVVIFYANPISITISRLCNNQKFKIMKENCIFEGKEMVVGENRDWEI